MQQTYDERIRRLSDGGRPQLATDALLLPQISSKGKQISVPEVRALIKIIKSLFEKVCEEAGYTASEVRALTTKFRDAGRRSAPWKPTSSRVPGRPQDGSDGNRINRWLMPVDHKFYANEIDATLVEVKYYLQALSMKEAPACKEYKIDLIFTPWLVRHPVSPGNYADPLQRNILSFKEFIQEPRLIQSGHLDPLDRDGRHVPENTYLMLGRSNQIQGNMKMEELIQLMNKIVEDHKTNPFI